MVLVNHKLLLYYINMNKQRGFNYNKLAGSIREAGMTQRDVAQAMGASYNTINNWCNGRSEPTVDKFIQVLAAIGWDDARIQNETRLLDWWTV